MTSELDYFGRVLLVSLCLGGFGSASYANEPPSSRNNATSSTSSAPRTLAEAAAQGSGSGGRTDIVARVDSPRVTNILPWQEQPLKTPKNPLSISALDGSLNPTDRDRLIYETQYSRLLNQTTDSAVSPNRP